LPFTGNQTIISSFVPTKELATATASHVNWIEGRKQFK